MKLVYTTNKDCPFVGKEVLTVLDGNRVVLIRGNAQWSTSAITNIRHGGDAVIISTANSHYVLEKEDPNCSLETDWEVLLPSML